MWELFILLYGDENDCCGYFDENLLQDWILLSCWCQFCFEVYLVVQVCGLEKVGLDQFIFVWCYYCIDFSGIGNYYVFVVFDGLYFGECQLLFVYCFVEGGVVVGYG